jgi:uncharacterized repeat protein (TIGR02543 family)
MGNEERKMKREERQSKKAPHKFNIFYIFICYFLFTILSCENPFIIAIVEPKTVSFESNGGSSVESQTVYKGQQIKRPSDPSRSGYTFDAWYSDNGTFLQEWDFSVIPTGDITLYAKWNPDSGAFTITFDKNGGDIDANPASITVNEGSLITAPEPPARADFNFAGWYTEAECINIWDFDTDTVTANITLYAKWEFDGDPVIRSAAITVISPIANAAPNTTANGAGNFTVSAVTWTPAASAFTAGVQYTASVTLTAKTYYYFAEDAGFTATVNGYPANVANNAGDTVTISYQFGPAPDITGISIKTQPNLVYTHGQTLNLSALVVTLTYGGDAHTEDVAFAAFAGKNISESPVHGTALVRMTHNGTTVTVRIGDYTADTNPLTVNKAIPAAITWPVASAITYGAALSTSTLTGGSTTGIFAWQTGATIPTVTNSGYNVVFTPSDTDNYDWSNITLTQAVAITVNPAPIASAVLSVTAPANGGTPAITASGTGNFTVGTVTWSPSAATFTTGVQYTVIITLTANANYTFTGGLATRTINGNTATPSNNTGASVTLSWQFAAIPAGPTWTAVTNSTFDTSSISAIAYGNNRFIAGGSYGRMAYSADGVTWTAITGTDITFNYNDINAIAYGNNTWVAVGYSGKMAYSTNGITWTAVADSTFDTSSIRAIAYGNNRFVAVGDSGKMAYSTDNGVTWTAVTNSTINISYQIASIAYGNNRFVAGSNGGTMAYSADGITWTAVTNSTFGVYGILAIAYGNNRWVAVGNSGKMAYSSDGISWTAVTDSTFGTGTSGYIYGIAYGGGRFVAVGASDKMAYSTDGVNWTAVADSTFGTSSIRAIAYGNNRFVAVGDSGKMAYSNEQ